MNAISGKFCQWCFYRQWAALKSYANLRGVEIVGDMPIFVSAHSADVWANQPLFDLDERGWPRAVAGVPPDYFSETGQHWGNPLYNWTAHANELIAGGPIEFEARLPCAISSVSRSLPWLRIVLGNSRQLEDGDPMGAGEPGPGARLAQH